ncbi:hypothetical protein BaRGS_00009268 [Batillaria attramentaria]|uniref:Uncharacterized protein n=1 Tax=Batillaria attramentaria TaxID=370345 RepID=A0ABD0LJB3_9CAEN
MSQVSSVTQQLTLSVPTSASTFADPAHRLSAAAQFFRVTGLTVNWSTEDDALGLRDEKLVLRYPAHTD